MKTNNPNNEPLSDREKALFDQLRSDIKPPKDLEAGVIQSLNAKNLIPKNKNTMTRSIITGIAATITALICGFFIGNNYQSNTRTDTSMNKYILLLYENDGFHGGEETNLVKEYTQWAVDLSEKGQLESAEKLSDEGKWLGNASTQNKESKMVGYFVVLAKDYQQALSLAKTHPHVGYGGGIELRPIEKLN